MNQKYYTVTETAAIFNVSRQTIHNWMIDGKIDYIEAGRGPGKIIIIPAAAIAETKKKKIKRLENKIGRLQK